MPLRQYAMREVRRSINHDGADADAGRRDYFRGNHIKFMISGCDNGCAHIMQARIRNLYQTTMLDNVRTLALEFQRQILERLLMLPTPPYSPLPQG